MKTILSTIIIIAALLWIGELTITFKPFSISLPGWYKAVGILLFWLSMVVYQSGTKAKLYKEGFNDGTEYIIKKLNDKMQGGNQ